MFLQNMSNPIMVISIKLYLFICEKLAMFTKGKGTLDYGFGKTHHSSFKKTTITVIKKFFAINVFIPYTT